MGVGRGTLALAWAVAAAAAHGQGPTPDANPAPAAPPTPPPAASATTPAATPAATSPAATAKPAPRAPAPAAQRKAQQAEEAGKAGDFRAALFLWQEATNLDPQNAEYRMRLGESYERLSFWGEAVRQYETAAALDPPGSEALRRAARARALRDGKEVPAEAPRTSPASADSPGAAAYEAGVALIAKGQYREALASLDEAVRKDAGLAPAYCARASALFGLARYAESAADYRTALALDPSQATPLFGLGECNRILGQGAAAAEYYARYLESGAPDGRDDLRAEARRRLDELRR
jgi:Flp pilus assembly protein TadD